MFTLQGGSGIANCGSEISEFVCGGGI